MKRTWWSVPVVVAAAVSLAWGAGAPGAASYGSDGLGREAPITLHAVPVRASNASEVVGADTISFAENVLPIFENRCARCHGGVDENGDVRTEIGLNLLRYEGVMEGSDYGTVVEAGSGENSYLLELIVEGTMPEEGDPLPEEEIAVIRAWIEAGAPNN